MSKSNPFDINTALPKDVRENISKNEVDNFALLFNRMAHFAEKENIDANQGKIENLLNKEIKAYFFYKSKQKGGKHLDLTKKWNISEDLKKKYGQFLSDFNAAAKALFSTPEEIKLTAQWRIAIGLGNESVYENGFTFHPTYGIPYLPGSSLKGMTRHWAVANNKDKDQIIQILGNPNDEKEAFQQGRVIFFDAYPTSLKEGMLQPDIMNNHYPEYYEGKKPPADWLSPRPIFFLTMREVEFQFLLGIIPRGGIKKEDEDLLRTAKEWLQEALFESGVGAKTAVGYGRFRRYKQPKS